MKFQCPSAALTLPPAYGGATRRFQLIWYVLIVFVAATGTAFYARYHAHDRPFILSFGVVAWIIAVLFVSCYRGMHKKSVSAGRGWFASNDGFVRTDKLTELRARVIMSDTYVSLRDAECRHVDVPMDELTADPQIWQFVQAGVNESLTNGLAVDDGLTANLFHLPHGDSRTGGSSSVLCARNVVASLSAVTRSGSGRQRRR